MNWSFWKPAPGAPATTPRRVLVLRGWDEQEMRDKFRGAPDDPLFAATLEECDQFLLETVNDLVNRADGLTDGQVRQYVGQLRGLTELRDRLEAREAQALKDRDEAKPETEQDS